MEGPFLPVQVTPNASVATGEIESVSSLPDRAQDAVICLHVRQAESVAGVSDFVSSEVGRSIDVVVRRGRQLDLQTGSTVQLKISYEGDERGGGFYANASDYELVT